MDLIDNRIISNVKESIQNIASSLYEENKDLSQLLINNFSELEKSIYDATSEYSWPMWKSTFLIKFSLNKNTLESHIKQLYKRGLLMYGQQEDLFIEGNGRMAATYINQKGAIKILKKTQSIEGAKFLRSISINIHIKKCFLYNTIIKHILRKIDNPKIEFALTRPRYKIDLYLEKSKLPIECDELGHDRESYESRIDREEDIKQKIGCHEFLRFNPHDNNFNFEKLLKCIIYHIIGKQINGQDPIDYYMGKPTAEALAQFI
jgi:hypothetical protein